MACIFCPLLQKIVKAIFSKSARINITSIDIHFKIKQSKIQQRNLDVIGLFDSQLRKKCTNSNKKLFKKTILKFHINAKSETIFFSLLPSIITKYKPFFTGLTFKVFSEHKYQHLNIQFDEHNSVLHYHILLLLTQKLIFIGTDVQEKNYP